MSEYKFKAIEVTSVTAQYRGSNVDVVLEMGTLQAKAAFLELAGDTRGNELAEWMAEIGYDIIEKKDDAA